MKWAKVVFSGHAIQRMFERSLKKEHVLKVIEEGIKIADYPDDKPFPSCLLLGFIGEIPLHVVTAFDTSSQICHIVTAYVPDLTIWNKDFKTRRST